MLPTIEEILQLPEVQRGRPLVVAGAAAIKNRVRWVHVSELLDIARFLRGGELLLTTGLTLPEEPSGLANYVRNLAAAELGGLVVELGRRYGELPTVMIRVAEMENLPLIVLTREVPFVSVTEAVHSLIVDERLARLQFANEVHRTFQTLSMDGASVKDVLREAATLLNAPVVFEGPGHQILAFESGGARDPDLLDDWENRSRRAMSTDRSAVVGPERWLYTSVGSRGETWGRLIVLIRTEPTEEQFMVAEWAATTLVVNRLVERDQASLDRLTHRNMLTELISGNKANWFELRSRLQGAGIPTQDRPYIALSISRKPTQGKDIGDDADLDRELADSAAAAANRTKLPNLVGSLRPNCVAMLVVLPAKYNRTMLLNELAKNIHEHASLRSNTQLVIGMGSVVNSLQEARRSIVEANQVADVASAMSVHKLFYEISDVRLRGLLHYLRNDSRVQDFVERELGPLVRHDRDSGGDLLGALTVFLDAGRNTSSAAAAYHLSRPAFYGRLKTIEKLLNVNLNTIDDCLSLHVALIAMKIMRDREIFTSAANLF